MSLVELLVGVLLGGTAMAGALSAFATGSATYRSSEAVSRLNERAQYLLTSLTADLQLAGYYGLNEAALLTAAEPLPVGARLCHDTTLPRLAHAVEVQDNHYGLSCAAHAAGALPGADVLTVRRASVQLAAPQPGRLQLLTSIVDPHARALLSSGRLPAGVVIAAGRTELRDLLVRSYYVARASDGADATQPSLRVKSLTSIAGAAAVIDTEVMPGVEDLQVETGYRDTRTGALRFVTPALLPADAKPVALRLMVLLRSDIADRRHIDRRHYRYAGRDVAPQDHFHRLLVNQTLLLRNASQAGAT